jgi:hypothetical protein
VTILEKPYQFGEKNMLMELGKLDPFLYYGGLAKGTFLHTAATPLHPLCLPDPSSRSHVTLHFTLVFHHHLSFIVERIKMSKRGGSELGFSKFYCKN